MFSIDNRTAKNLLKATATTKRKNCFIWKKYDIEKITSKALVHNEISHEAFLIIINKQSIVD